VTGGSPTTTGKERKRLAMPVALTYALAGGLWILLSDRLAAVLITDPVMHSWVDTAKGWLFVAVTAAALYSYIAWWQARQRRGEWALRESEERYRTLVELSPDAIIIHSGGVIRFANMAVAGALGLPNGQELVGRPIMDLVHPDSHAELEDRLKRFSAGEARLPSTTLKFVGPDGTQLLGDVQAAHLDFEGSPAVLAVIRNVTDRRREEERLRWLSRVVEQVGEGVCVYDNQQRVTFANDAWAAMHGYTAEELVGKHHHLFHTEEQLRNEIPRWDTEALKGGKITEEVWHVRRDGTPFPVEMTITPLTEDTGRVAGRIAFARDIGQRKEAERLLTESESKFRVLAENSISSIMVFRGNQLTYTNPATENITGRTRDELLGRGFWDLVHPAHQERVRQQARLLLSGEAASIHMEFKILTGQGSERWVDFRAGAMELDGQASALGTAFEITDRKDTENRLDHLAHYDALTGLPNRLLFYERLADALHGASALGDAAGLLFIDLDRFKDVNDALGHDMGDLVLQGVSRRLLRCVSPGGMAARTGSDEFALLLRDLKGPGQAEEAARKLLAELVRPFTVAGQEIHVTASIGICLYPADGTDLETLMRNADIAMYRAKASGGSTYHFVTPGLSKEAGQQMALKNRLRKAIDLQEFKVHFQPVLDLASGRLQAMEALVRWDHPELGMLLPHQFVPLAEETGLIMPLGEWVLFAACAQNRAWQKAGRPPIQVSVNLSARQFQQRDLTETIELVLRSTGMEAQYLALEITESAAMADMDNTVDVLRRLSDLGISIAIDDFGTGYSSLSYLKKFPIQQLKIDHSFIRDVPDDLDDAAIVRAVVTMAHALDLRVVAEGVETARQLEFLREVGCDAVQGFYFKDPRPAEAWTRGELNW